MSVILFVDMLGSRKRWQQGGVETAMASYFRFKSMVNVAARRAPVGEVLHGGIETDSAALVCASVTEATRLARRLYLTAFAGKHNPAYPRLWLRGCIVPNSSEDPLRTSDHLREPISAVNVFRYSAPALEAISVEKSGFKGMRLLVKRELIDLDVQTQMKVAFENHTLVPFRVLNHSFYPPRVAGEYTDFLWMAGSNNDEWHDLNLNMMSRLRYAAKDQEEFAQAAATQVVFHEYAAIRTSVMGRAKRAAEA